MNHLNSSYMRRAHEILAAFCNQGKANVHKGKPSSAQEQEKLQKSPGGWPVTRDTLAIQIEQRLAGRNLPDQVRTNYCGCAAFLYCLLEDRPDWYVAYATALWRGEQFSFATPLGKVDVSTTEGTRQSLAIIHKSAPTSNAISDLDWMTMAGLSSATRYVSSWSPKSASPTDDFSAITWPWMMRRWFRSVGSQIKFDSVGFGAGGTSFESLLNLLALWGNHWIVLEIDPGLLNGGKGSMVQKHWVVVDPHTRLFVRPAKQSDG